MSFVIFLGAPGSGKGTQAQNLVRECPDKFLHISTGDLLREEIKKNSPLGKELQTKVTIGNLISDEIIFSLLEEKIKTISATKKIILDGFPRTIRQVELLSEFLEKSGKTIEKVVHFDIIDNSLYERLAKRVTCVECFAVYNEVDRPEVCSCGSTNFRFRADDNEVVVSNRLVIYHKETEPLVSHYEKLGLLIKINASQSVDCIKQELLEELKL